MTPEDKAIWEILAERRDGARKLLAEWEAEIETSEDKKRRAVLRRVSKVVSAKLQETVDQIGEWPNHRISRSNDEACEPDDMEGHCHVRKE